MVSEAGGTRGQVRREYGAGSREEGGGREEEGQLLHLKHCHLDVMTVVPELLGRELLGDVGDGLLGEAHIRLLPRHPVRLVHVRHQQLLHLVLEGYREGDRLASRLPVIGVWARARRDGGATAANVEVQVAPVAREDEEVVPLRT